MNSLGHIKITNYRSCLETKVDFRPGLTALIGRNGSGKTNILNGILLLSKGNSGRYRTRSSEIFSDSPQSALEATIHLDGEGFVIKASHYFELNSVSETSIYSEYSFRGINSRTWEPIEPLFFEYPPAFFRDVDHRHLQAVIQRELGRGRIEKMDLKVKIVSFLSSFSYYSATHFSKPGNSPVSLEFENDKFVHNYATSTIHERFLRDLYFAFQREEPLRQLNQIVGGEGLGLVDEIRFEEASLPTMTYSIFEGGRIQQRQKNKRIVMPLVKIDGSSLSFSQLSEGTFKTLALIFYILNDQNELLIIEEPEVCIHHGLLSSLVELIKDESSRKQIIISTHSDYVLDQLDAEDVVLVKRESALGTTASSIKNSMAANDFRMLKEYLAESGGLGGYWRESGFEND